MVCLGQGMGAHAGVKQSQWGGVRGRWELNWLQIDWSPSHLTLPLKQWSLTSFCDEQSEATLCVDTWWCVSLCRPDLHNNAASHYHFTLNQSDDWFEVNINWVGLYYYDNSDGQRNVWGFSVKLIIHHCLVLTGCHRDTGVDQSEGRNSLNWPIRYWESVQVLTSELVPGWC